MSRLSPPAGRPFLSLPPAPLIAVAVLTLCAQHSLGQAGADSQFTGAYRECTDCTAGDPGVLDDGKGNFYKLVTDPKQLGVETDNSKVHLSDNALKEKKKELKELEAGNEKEKNKNKEKMDKLREEIESEASSDFIIDGSIFSALYEGYTSKDQALNACLTTDINSAFCQDSFKQLAKDNPDLIRGDPNGPFTFMQGIDGTITMVGGQSPLTQSQKAAPATTPQPEQVDSRTTCERYPDLCEDNVASLDTKAKKGSGLLTKLGLAELPDWGGQANGKNCLNKEGKFDGTKCADPTSDRKKLSISPAATQKRGTAGDPSTGEYETVAPLYDPQSMSARFDPELGRNGGGGEDRVGDDADDGGDSGPRWEPPTGPKGTEVPDSVDELLRQVQMLFGQGRDSDGQALLEQGMSYFPDAAEIPQEAARKANADHDFDRAEKMAKKAIRLDPKNAAGYQELAWAKLYQKDPQAALQAAQSAVRLAPQSAFSLVLRALAYEQLGKRDLMLADLEAAARLDNTFSNHLTLARQGRRLFHPASDNSDQLRGKIDLDYSSDPAKDKLGVFGIEIELPEVSAAPLAAGILVLGTLSGFAVLAWRRRKNGVAVIGRQPDGPPSARPNTQRYRPQRELGRGTKSVVWEAYDTAEERLVVIKTISDPTLRRGSPTRASFVKEAGALTTLKHPDIAHLNEVLDLPTGLFLVYEMVDGLTLAKLLTQVSRLPFPVAVRILERICAALEYAHGRGVVHGALKPSDILLRRDGAAMLLDVGLARALPGPASAYAAPETVSGVAGPASDVYALGLCLHQMLTGALPNGATPRVSAAVPGLPPQVDEVISRALRPEPNARTRSARDFMVMLSSARAFSAAPRAPGPG